MSTLIVSQAPEVIPIIINCQTSREIWQTLKRAYASPSATRIMGLYIALQQLKQKPDEVVTTYLHHGKTFVDELAAVGKPRLISEMNVYLLKGLKHGFKDIVTTIAAQPELVSFDEMQSLLLTHEFMNQDTFQGLNIMTDSPTALSPSPTAKITGKSKHIYRRL